MKRTLIARLLLMVVVLLFIAACAGETAEETTAYPPQNSETGEGTAVEVPEVTEEPEIIEEAPEITEEPPMPTEEVMEEITPEPIQPVALLVVDDFAGEPLIEESQDDDDAGQLCTVTPEGQIFKGEGLIFKGEGLSWVRIPGVSHGELVYNQLLDMLSGIYGAPVNSPLGASINSNLAWMGNIPIQVWEVSGINVLLVPVDTQHYDSGVIADRLAVTMEAITGYWGVENFVWNMSFGFIPCEVETALTNEVIEEVFLQLLEDEVDGDYLDVLQESLISAVGEEPPALTEDAAVNLLYDKIRVRYAYGYYQNYFETLSLPEVESDPFYLLSQSFISGEEGMNVFPIAAAGNSGFPEPFGPAIWPGFVAVSSLETDSTTAKATYSNNGEVALKHDYPLPDGTIVVGTSFAAPRLSFLATMYLLSGGPLTCGGAVTDATPPFNFDMWIDLPLEAAITDYCTGFPPS